MFKHAFKSKNVSAIRRLSLLLLLAATVSGVGLMRLSAKAAARGYGINFGTVTRPLVEELPEGVRLAYDHPPFKAGEIIPLIRVINGGVANPDRCIFRHLHSSSVAPTLFICTPGGGPQGPYIDQNPGECGHGEVIPLATDIEVRMEAPSIATVQAEIFVTVTAKPDEDNPTTILVAKKAGKKIQPGGTAKIQVQKEDGTLSSTFTYTRPQ